MNLKPGTYWLKDRRDQSWTILHVSDETHAGQSVRAYSFLGAPTFYKDVYGNIWTLNGSLQLTTSYNKKDFIERWLNDPAIELEEFDEGPCPIAPDEEHSPERPHNPVFLEEMQVWPTFQWHTGQTVVISTAR